MNNVRRCILGATIKRRAEKRRTLKKGISNENGSFQNMYNSSIFLKYYFESHLTYYRQTIFNLT